MDTEQKVLVLEGVLAAVVDRALNGDALPPAVVRLALADALHTVQALERQANERRAAEQQAAAGGTKEAENDGEQIQT